jgi:hypothetical protein
LPAGEANSEPWFSLWSALAHQGDVFNASFAAVPYVVQALESSPLKAGTVYFLFPAWIEICRQKNGIEIDSELRSAYFEALNKLPKLVSLGDASDWPSDKLAAGLAAIAAVKGRTRMAEVLVEMDEDVAAQFMSWFFNRDSIED